MRGLWRRNGAWHNRGHFRGRRRGHGRWDDRWDRRGQRRGQRAGPRGGRRRGLRRGGLRGKRARGQRARDWGRAGRGHGGGVGRGGVGAVEAEGEGPSLVGVSTRYLEPVRALHLWDEGRPAASRQRGVGEVRARVCGGEGGGFGLCKIPHPHVCVSTWQHIRGSVRKGVCVFPCLGVVAQVAAEEVLVLGLHHLPRRHRGAAVVERQHALEARVAEAGGEDERGGLVDRDEVVGVLAALPRAPRLDGRVAHHVPAAQELVGAGRLGRGQGHGRHRAGHRAGRGGRQRGGGRRGRRAGLEGRHRGGCWRRHQRRKWSRRQSRDGSWLQRGHWRRRWGWVRCWSRRRYWRWLDGRNRSRLNCGYWARQWCGQRRGRR